MNKDEIIEKIIKLSIHAKSSKATGNEIEYKVFSKKVNELIGKHGVDTEAIREALRKRGIEVKEGAPKLGELYTTTWARPGCTWKLVAVVGEWCTLVTTKTKKKLRAKISELVKI